MSNNLDFPVLVGDIGGTNTRFGIVRDRHSDLELLAPAITNDYAQLQDAVEDIVLSRTSVIPKRLVMAIAAPILGCEYQLTNAKWIIKPHDVINDLNLSGAEFMNDFSAQALGVLTIDHDAMRKIGNGKPTDFGTRVVLGPGTGFGIAIIIHATGRWTILPSEGAYMDNGFGTGQNSERELQIQRHLERRCGRQVIENTVSGAGLVNLYQAICKANNVTPKYMYAAQISGAADHEMDDAALEAVRFFTTLLGRIAGNLALGVCASGGVYVTGGMAYKMQSQIEACGFRTEFENKAPYEELVRNIPTYFVNREHAALEGLANYVCTPEGFDLTHASAFYHAK